MLNQRILFLIIISILVGCSTLQELANIQKPAVSVENIQISGLNFNQLDLLFNLGIENPNQLAITLAGLNYEFYLNDQSFVKGISDSTQIIAAKTKSQLEIPVSLDFKNIYQTYQSLKSQDSSDYKMQIGLTFELPVIGRTILPISKEGKVPLIKFPSVKVNSLKLKNLNLTSASLELDINLDNPNSLSLMLNQFNYQLRINQQNWLSGNQSQPQKINAKASQSLKIPFSLNFLEIGQTVYQTLQGNQNLNYDFSGKITVKGSDSLIPSTDIPFTTTGILPLKR